SALRLFMAAWPGSTVPRPKQSNRQSKPLPSPQQAIALSAMPASWNETAMKIAASNLIFPAFKHIDLLPVLPELGIEGLEVAPAHTWLDPWDGVPSAEVRAYRKAAKAAGLKITGLHCLLSGRPDLGLFDLPGMGGRTINYVVQLSAICRDLGGKTLILGPRWRRRLTDRTAWLQGRAFLELLLERIETHGTVLCF